MKKLTISLIITVAFFFQVNAQETRDIKIESASVTNGEANIKGKRVPYKATAGTMPVWNEDGKPIASLFFTYYEIYIYNRVFRRAKAFIRIAKLDRKNIG